MLVASALMPAGTDSTIHRVTGLPPLSTAVTLTTTVRTLSPRLTLMPLGAAGTVSGASPAWVSGPAMMNLAWALINNREALVSYGIFVDEFTSSNRTGKTDLESITNLLHALDDKKRLQILVALRDRVEAEQCRLAEDWVYLNRMLQRQERCYLLLKRSVSDMA